jgi:GT2 family glycosyltransferase
LANCQPEVPLVHGFCFGIRKEVIDHIGFFDEIFFDRYYGEENDYCFRASSAGFKMVIATHTFVFHRKSASIEEEERLIYMKKAGKRLRKMYGVEKVKLACLQMENHPLLKRMRCHAQGFY